ncbi:omega gliadin [Histomonas meleagridis]|uniref:omega gliadin n=1 Tax=Histomonas meleagridis TaxID=135588 RepID=UPI00355A94B0|nr:omega gliadin [Histomonas meleagridis]KAH0796269.1 omega gliadin [Histomonas meleagridis]
MHEQSQNVPPIFQKTAFIRIRKVFVPGSRGNEIKNLLIQLIPDGSGVVSPLIKSQVRNFYFSTAIPILRYSAPTAAQVSFKILEVKERYGEREVAKLLLPLIWFPSNMVTRYFFPFMTRTPEKGTPMIEIDIHLSENNSPPFKAPHGNLLVTPMWVVPPELKINIQQVKRKEKYAMPGYPAGPQQVQKQNKEVKTQKVFNQSAYIKISSDSDDEYVGQQNVPPLQAAYPPPPQFQSQYPTHPFNQSPQPMVQLSAMPPVQVMTSDKQPSTQQKTMRTENTFEGYGIYNFPQLHTEENPNQFQDESVPKHT